MRPIILGPDDVIRRRKRRRRDGFEDRVIKALHEIREAILFGPKMTPDQTALASAEHRLSIANLRAPTGPARTTEEQAAKMEVVDAGLALTELAKKLS